MEVNILKKSVVFDMDGVLVNTEYFYFKRRMKFFNELEINPGSKQIDDFIGLTNSMIWEMLVPKDTKKRKVLQEEYVKYCNEHPAYFPELLNPSIKRLFKELKDKKIKIAIASSSAKNEILRMLKECELKPYVDFVISGDECKKSKPDPEIYRLATNALNSLPEEVLAVEDSMLGIRSAKSAGLTVAALAQKDYYANQTEADYKINDLIEITSII